eukprot:242784_1
MGNLETYSTVVTIVYASVYTLIILITSIAAAIECRVQRNKIQQIPTKIQEETNEFKQIDEENDKNHKDNYDIYDKNAFKHYFKLLWAKKKVYWAMVPHIFDQATDIGVILEYYYLYNNNIQIGNLKPFWLFCISLSILAIHRFVSTITVYILTKNAKDAFLQIFDLLLMKVIYISYKLKANEPTNLQRYLGLLEATFESAPQIMISMVVILKSSRSNESLSEIILISTIFSLWSLASRVISDDKLIFHKDWQSINFSYKKCPIINYRYLIRATFRFLEITNKICLWSLLWINIGGFALCIVVGVETFYLLILCILTKTPDPMGMIMYLTYTFSDNDAIRYTMNCFWFYRIMSFYIYMILITIFSSVHFESQLVDNYKIRNNNTIQNEFGLFMLIYGWISGPLWMLIGWNIFREWGILKENAATTRDLLVLAEGKNFIDVIELFECGVKVNNENKAILLMDRTFDELQTYEWDSKTTIMAVKIFKSIMMEYPLLMNKDDGYGSSKLENYVTSWGEYSISRVKIFKSLMVKYNQGLYDSIKDEGKMFMSKDLKEALLNIMDDVKKNETEHSIK